MNDSDSLKMRVIYLNVLIAVVGYSLVTRFCSMPFAVGLVGENVPVLFPASIADFAFI